MKRLSTVIAIIAFIVVALLSLSARTSYSQGTLPTASPVAILNACEALLARAINALATSCQSVGRNKACYGNIQVKAEANNNVSLRFDTVGDIANIADIHTLTTFPLDVEKGVWGLSLLKLQANLPDTLPGQNVTFLVFGNTHIDNASGDMQTFYFTSGLGNDSCKEAPHDSIVVKAPQRTNVTFTANGVKITIASTVVLRAERGKTMSIGLIEGHATVETAFGKQSLTPGDEVSVPLGGLDGFTPVGAPSVPKPSNEDSSLAPVVQVASKIGDPTGFVNITIKGCVTAVQGNLVVVNGYVINTGNNPALRRAKVGDCVVVQGRLQGGSGQGITFVPVPVIPSGNGTGNGNANGNSTGQGTGSSTGSSNGSS
ncbi:MAG: hypothetical protein ABI947_04175, partial [Chloroflexota bacterium]